MAAIQYLWINMNPWMLTPWKFNSSLLKVTETQWERLVFQPPFFSRNSLLNFRGVNSGKKTFMGNLREWIAEPYNRYIGRQNFPEFVQTQWVEGRCFPTCRRKRHRQVFSLQLETIDFAQIWSTFLDFHSHFLILQKKISRKRVAKHLAMRSWHTTVTRNIRWPQPTRRLGTPPKPAI